MTKTNMKSSRWTCALARMNLTRCCQFVLFFGIVFMDKMSTNAVAEAFDPVGKGDGVLQALKFSGSTSVILIALLCWTLGYFGLSYFFAKLCPKVPRSNFSGSPFARQKISVVLYGLNAFFFAKFALLYAIKMAEFGDSSPKAENVKLKHAEPIVLVFIILKSIIYPATQKLFKVKAKAE